MKHYLLAAAILTFAAHFTPMDDFDANLKDSLSLLRDLTEALKPVKDQASAESALPKVKAINGRLAELKKKDDNTFKLAPEEYEALRAKYGTKFEAALKSLDAELARTNQKLDFKSPLREQLDQFKEASSKMHVMTEAKVSATILHLKAIDKALEAYKAKTGKYPDALFVLTEGKDALLKEDALRDPWERPYCYDASGTINRGKKPDVWTDAPTKERVGNWEKDK